ncbi:unnamed protein product [Phytophthora lilii]|uniref:RxLR effector protein n=1 Tax=Phytophthora lilii TaxID=2077276 RepID=A0A9W6TBA4_9STRA|nr:unnamed protein product [Phytophthora lilii]
MRASYIVFMAVTPILANISGSSAATDLTRNKLAGAVQFDEVTQTNTNRLQRSHKIVELEDEDNEERSVAWESRAAKLNDMLPTLRAVHQKSPKDAFTYLQQSGLAWPKREAILSFLHLDGDDRKKVVQLIVEANAVRHARL